MSPLLMPKLELLRVDNVQTIKYSVILIVDNGIHETAETKK
jgi:hypothetical protein